MAWVRDKGGSSGKEGRFAVGRVWETAKLKRNWFDQMWISCGIVVQQLYNSSTTNRQQIEPMEYDPWVLRREWKSSWVMDNDRFYGYAPGADWSGLHIVANANNKAVLSRRRPRDAISVWSSNKGTIQRRKQRGVADAVPKLRTKARPTSSLSKISLCSPGNYRWMTFGLRRAKTLG